MNLLEVLMSGKPINFAIFSILSFTPQYQGCSVSGSSRQVYNAAFQRVIDVADDYDTYATKGVSIDYSHNETKIGGDDYVISAPGCPKSIDGYPWIYYGDNPTRCYLAGFPGPCNYDEFLFLIDADSKSGVCACSCLKDKGNLERSQDGRFILCGSSEMSSFDLLNKQCYNFRSQGPCNSEEVFIRKSNSNSVKCVARDNGQCGFKFYNYQTETCEDQPEYPGGQGGGGGFGGSVGYILPNSCEDNQQFSKRLKMCVSKRRIDDFIIG